MSREFLRFAGVVACGLVTTLLVAQLDVRIDRATGFELFSFGLWFVIPVGAMLCGALAGSGYAVGAWLTGAQARPWIVLKALGAAVITHATVLYTGYRLATLDDGRSVSAVTDFGNYLTVIIEHAHLAFGRTAAYETGEVAKFGYLIIVVHFVGCLIGTLAPWAILASFGRCADCERYTRPMGKRIQLFRSHNEARPHLQAVQAHAHNTLEFAELVARPITTRQPGKNAIRFVATLDRCTGCERWLLRDKVEYQTNGRWETLPGARYSWFTEPVPGLVRAFSQAGAATR